MRAKGNAEKEQTKKNRTWYQATFSGCRNHKEKVVQPPSLFIIIDCVNNHCLEICRRRKRKKRSLF